MDVNYGSSSRFSLGVEEEFQLLNADSFDLTSRFGGGTPLVRASGPWSFDAAPAPPAPPASHRARGSAGVSLC